MNRELISPRPLFIYEEEPKGKMVLVLGTRYSGIVLYVTKEGIEFNGYYTSADGNTKYGVLKDFIKVPWNEFEKMKQDVFRKRKRQRDIQESPSRTEDNVPQEYLDSLPVVTLNGRRFFVDLERRERRPVDNPKHVFKFREPFSERTNMT